MRSSVRGRIHDLDLPALNRAYPKGSARVRPAHALALLLFTAIAIFYFGRSLRSFSDAMIAAGPDASSFVWYLKWWPHALATGINPFVSYQVWVPAGANLAWTTSIPGLALGMAPITAAFGPVVSFNVVSLLAPALSAFTAYLLAWHLTRKFWPAAVAGYIFGFSSYELGQMAGGHVNLATVFLLPLGVLLYLRRRGGEIGRWPFMAGFTVALVFQFSISTEIFAAAVFFAVATLVVATLLDGRDFQKHEAPVVAESVVSTLIAGAILSPFLYYALTGYRAALTSPMDWPVHPLNYFIPTPITGIGGGFFEGLTSHFPGNRSEQGAYLGIPLLIIFGLFVKEFRGRPGWRVLIISSTIVFVAALGPVLDVWAPPRASATPPGYVALPGPWQIQGRPLPIPLPWFPFAHLPFLDNMIPMRFTLFLWLCIAVVTAVWLADAPHGAGVKAGVAGLAVVCLLPSLSHPFANAIDAPAFFRTGLHRAHLVRGENVIVLPYDYEGNSMLWQAQTGWYFRMAGGYTGPTPRDFSPLKRFYLWFNRAHPVVPPGCRDELLSFIAAHDVGAIIVQQPAMPVFKPYLSTLGIADREVGGVSIYRIPRGLRSTVAPATASPARCAE
jgi:hypothetical protein